jgi:hypothetical protein
MTRRQFFIPAVSGALAVFLMASTSFVTAPAHAQEVGKVLPDRRPGEFKGVIGETYKASRPDFPKTREAPAGANGARLTITTNTKLQRD